MVRVQNKTLTCNLLIIWHHYSRLKKLVCVYDRRSWLLTTTTDYGMNQPIIYTQRCIIIHITTVLLIIEINWPLKEKIRISQSKTNRKSSHIRQLSKLCVGMGGDYRLKGRNSKCWVRSWWQITGQDEVTSWRESGRAQTSLWAAFIPELRPTVTCPTTSEAPALTCYQLMQSQLQ